jgi:chromosome segregation ATPase
MNKPTQIKSEESQINVNKNQRKSKFNKFFSTVTAVMIASSIAIGPMTLRGEETETKKDIKKAVQLMEKEIEKNNKKIEENNKENEKSKEKIKEADRTIKEADERIQLADERIKEADENIQKADKEIDKNNKILEEAKREEMEAKRQEMEADKELNKIKEKCNIYLDWLIKVKKHCSEKECSDELKNKIVKSEKEYNKECSELMASTSK